MSWCVGEGLVIHLMNLVRQWMVQGMRTRCVPAYGLLSFLKLVLMLLLWVELRVFL